MNKRITGLLIVCVLMAWHTCFAQTKPAALPPPKPKESPGAEIDSLRKREEGGQDTVVFTAKYIRYTTLRFLNDSTYTAPIDTSLRNLQNFSPQYDPYSPTLNLGNDGLSSRNMLFDPQKTIGFDAGFHALDRYVLNQDSVKYYRARTPFTQLWYVNGGQPDQFFQLTHTQNIRPNWNFGAVYRRVGADGYYVAQRADHTNVMAFTWYQSTNKRYNLIANALFNTLKAGENGSVTDDNFFITNKDPDPGIVQGPTRLQGTRANRPAQSWKEREFFVKQYYYIGRVDSLNGDSSQAVLPTQRIAYSLSYTTNQFKFFRNESDALSRVFPAVIPDSIILTKDSTTLSDLRNEFTYSFYLRGRSVSFLKNEVKLDVGLRNDLYRYNQFAEHADFQNTTLLGNAGYRFSNRVLLDANFEQVIQGRNLGDFRYAATTSFLYSKSVGKIILGACLLNQSPAHLFERVNYQFHQWNLSFKPVKTSNLSFEYDNPSLKLNAKAEYFLLNNYLYLEETSTARQVIPVQANNAINLLKISVGKNFSYRKFTFENYLVYQKTGSAAILRTPEAYLYNSFYRSQQFFKSIDSQIGIDSRYNTPFAMPEYAPDISQFYNGKALNYETYPVIDLWLKASLRRATIFLKENYINQNTFSPGYYTVNRYPMPNRQFLFGVKWNFYN